MGQHYVSSQLLCKLKEADESSLWEEHLDLLIWLLYMGGAFLPVGSTRSEYIAILNRQYSAKLGGLYRSWPGVQEVLKQFIWSHKVFKEQIKRFWEDSSEISSDNDKKEASATDSSRTL